MIDHYCSLDAHQTSTTEQQAFQFSTGSEQEQTITSVLTQSVTIPCKAILLIMEPERVRHRINDHSSWNEFFRNRLCGIK